MLSRAKQSSPPTTTGNKGSVERLSSETSVSSSSTDGDMMQAKKLAATGTGVSSGGIGSSSGPSPTNGSSGAGANSPTKMNSSGAVLQPSGANTGDTLAVAENPRRPSTGMIKVKLASASPQWDNKAEVEVDCENPDEVVDKMLQSIVDKFPPSSVITVERGGRPVYPQQPQQPRQPERKAAPPSSTASSIPPQQQPIQQQSSNFSYGFHQQSSNYNYGYPPFPPQQQMSKVRSQQSIMQDTPKTAPRVEVREVIKEVPRMEIEWVEKIVEVPQISYVDKYEEVPEVHEVVKHVAKIETVDVPREVIKYVPKVITKVVENIVEVPRGEKIPVMRPQPIDTCFVEPRFNDRSVPVVMAQSITPEIEETDEVIEVEVSKYVPYLVPVDVYVPLPVQVPVKAKSDGETTQVPFTTADPALLQHLMIELNPHLQQLELYNFQQQEQFQSLIQQSITQANEHGVAPPPPITNTAVLRCPSREKTGVSRSSSTGVSRRGVPSRQASRQQQQHVVSRHVSRRVTGGGQRDMSGTSAMHRGPSNLAKQATPIMAGGGGVQAYA